jgi:hypothetical protein
VLPFLLTKSSGLYVEEDHFPLGMRRTLPALAVVCDIFPPYVVIVYSRFPDIELMLNETFASNVL